MSKRNKAFKVRLYPTKSQIDVLNKTLGHSRFLYNQMLAERMRVYEELKDEKEKLYSYKYKTEKTYKEEFEFLKEADSKALQQSNRDLQNAYKNFYSSLSGKRKGDSGFPSFKKKKAGCSYRTLGAIDIDFEKKKVQLPKLGWIAYRDKRTNFKGDLKSATVSRTSTGKYFVSLLFEQELKQVEIPDLSTKVKVKGLDMSLDKFFVDQEGDSPAYERIYRNLEPKLKKAQRKLSKKKKGSKNWYKALHRVSVIHEQITNKRKDFTHKLLTSLVKENDVIVLETLSLKGMSQALNLGKSVMDLGYSNFINQLYYKSIESNCLVIQADQWFASSKTCSCCGFKKKDLTLSQRRWTCENCGKFHDRDQNAGQNLVNFGLDMLGLGQPDFKLVEKISDLDFSKSEQSSMKQEILSF